jgi:N-acetylmuramoyl-L-alanine amidase/Secretion system C-terminal sorting domain
MKRIIFSTFLYFTFIIVVQAQNPIIEQLLDKPVQVSIVQGDTFLQRDLSEYLNFTLGHGKHGNAEELKSDKHNAIGTLKSYFMKPHPSVSTTKKYFELAATEFGVPVSLLMVVGQVENNWTQTGPTIDKGWGIMHLVQNDYCNTLGEAAQLIGVSEQELKDNAYHNIRGAAALITKYAEKGKKSFLSIEDWFPALAKYSGLLNQELREMQAETYLLALKNGVSVPTVWGEVIKIEPESIDLEKIELGKDNTVEGDNFKIIPNDNSSDSIPLLTADYGPALAAFTSCNYSTGRNGYNIDTWVNHWIGTGTYAGAISWFQNCSANASAHFVIRSSDGQITQVVEVANTAWHAGASGFPANNRRSIGVEHEATAANPSLWNSNAMLNASATMSCFFQQLYGFPTTQNVSPGICGHNDMPGTSTSCPGTINWTNWFSYFNAACSPDNVKPTTVISASPVPFATTDFVSNFTDADDVGGSGVMHQFYQVADFNTTEWRANNNNGFFNDDFDVAIHPDWIDSSGVWSIIGTKLNQNDQANSNTNIYAAMDQNNSGKFLYHYKASISGTGTNKRAGFHYMSDDASQTNRGNSYFVWFRQDNGKLQFYKVNNNTFTLEKDVVYTFNAGQEYDYKIVYDIATGITEVYVDDVFIDFWQDPTPITLGNFVSFRSGDCVYDVDDLRIYKSRTASETITVGPSPTNDIRYENNPTTSGRINSIVIDTANNISIMATEMVDVDFLITSINDIQKENLSVYPNPFTNNITLTLNIANQVNLTLFDVEGRMVLTQNTTPKNKQIQLDLIKYKLNSGLYLLKVTSENITQTIRLIKQ